MKVMSVEFLLLFSLKFLVNIIFLILQQLATMSLLGWHHLHPVDNTVTQYLVDQPWNRVGVLDFLSFFLSICLSMWQSVCVFLHLFRINLKFLKTHNCWLAGNNEPLRVTPSTSHVYSDTQYLNHQHWQQCWCFRFSFFFVPIYLSMCRSVCVSVHLFRINLKFLKTIY